MARISSHRKSPGERDRWVGPVVQFFFGSLIGALPGIVILLLFFPDSDRGWLAIPISMFVLGTIAAIAGDAFWHDEFWNKFSWIGELW